MKRPQRITDRMLLAMSDAFAASHDTHRQVHDAVRDWSERVGRAELVERFKTEHEAKGEHND